jgi:hypothetical protein
MKRFWMHLFGGVVTTAGLATMAPACTHNNVSLFVQAVLAPPSGAMAGACAWTNEPTQAAYSYGVVDVEAEAAFANEYIAELLVANQLIPLGNTQQVMAETDRIIVQGAIVSITDADGSAIPGGTGSYTVYASGEVDPASGDTPGYAPIGVEIIDPQTMSALRKQLGPYERISILTTTTLFGYTLGGDKIESNNFTFPILACRGCLVDFDTADGVTPQPNCSGPMPTSTSSVNPCYYGQDVPLDCHLCAGSCDAMTGVCSGLPFCTCGATGITNNGCTLIGSADAGTGGGG